jgi:hypothetical protein
VAWLAAKGREVGSAEIVRKHLQPAGEKPAAAKAPAAKAKPDAKLKPALAAEPVRAVPKPVRTAPRSLQAPEKPMPPAAGSDAHLAPGTAVYHQRHGRGKVESVDPTLGRIIIDFSGKRMSLDLGWCLATPQFFRVIEA